jgi:anti-sigma factor (TIGR02949 family)
VTRAATSGLVCREVVELVTAYLDGSMPREDRRRFERHLSGCDGCTRYVEQMRSTVRIVGAISEESVPPGVREELLAAFRGWRSHIAE